MSLHFVLALCFTVAFVSFTAGLLHDVFKEREQWYREGAARAVAAFLALTSLVLWLSYLSSKLKTG